MALKTIFKQLVILRYIVTLSVHFPSHYNNKPADIWIWKRAKVEVLPGFCQMAALGLIIAPTKTQRPMLRHGEQLFLIFFRNYHVCHFASNFVLTKCEKKFALVIEKSLSKIQDWSSKIWKSFSWSCENKLLEQWKVRTIFQTE